jgi:hypothetical protein
VINRTAAPPAGAELRLLPAESDAVAVTPPFDNNGRPVKVYDANKRALKSWPT